jgi:hypothetical protein
MLFDSWRRRAVATAAVTLLPLLAVVTPSSASGQELRFADPRHDVVTIDPAADSLTPSPNPVRANGDITSAFVHFRKGRLVVRVDFAELTPRRNELFEYTGAIFTSQRRVFLFDVATSPGRYAGHDKLLRGNGKPACEVGHRLDRRQDFARVVIPLSCLDHPRWVRLGFGAITYAFDPELLATGKLQAGGLLARVDHASRDDRDDLGVTPRINVPRHGWTA